MQISTKPARFTSALTIGFLVASVGCSAAFLGGDSSAEGFFDLFGVGSMFDQPTSNPVRPAMKVHYAKAGHRTVRSAGRTQVRTHATARLEHHARHAQHPTRVQRVQTVSSTPVSASAKAPVSASTKTGGPTGGQSMCVRLCDGFAFPLGSYHGAHDRAAHEATCRSECPGAETALFVMPAGSDAISNAVAADGSGRNYTKLPLAFHYTTMIADVCSCHPASGNRVMSVLHDFTLRRGDAVVTETGLRVFHGSSRFPYKRDDFMPLTLSRDVGRSNRDVLKSLEHAIVVAQIGPTPTVRLSSR